MVNEHGGQSGVTRERERERERKNGFKISGAGSASVSRGIFRNVKVRNLTLKHGRWVTVRPVRAHLTPKMNIIFFVAN